MQTNYSVGVKAFEGSVKQKALAFFAIYYLLLYMEADLFYRLGIQI